MNLPSETVLDIFKEISRIPRCSKNETRISQWIQKWAAENEFAMDRDTMGNLLVTVPGRGRGQNSAPVALQSHLDMVCEKAPHSRHDFETDGLHLIVDGDWLRADNTTLGADNGIGMALAIYAASKAIPERPPLELLFTVDEETGLNGANGLGAEFLSATRMINLDSEQEGVFTIGCAGGLGTTLSKQYPTFRPLNTDRAFDIKIGGLLGGHSGVDIHLQRANANKLLVRTLKALFVDAPFQISYLKGGSAHNALARDAACRIVSDSSPEDLWRTRVDQLQSMFRQEFKGVEPTLKLQLEAVVDPPQPHLLSVADSKALLNLIDALPHGVARFCDLEGDLVETSCNLAIVEMVKGTLNLVSSQRSLVDTRLAELTAKVHAVAGLGQATPTDSKGYPAWSSDTDSPLLSQAQASYASLFRTKAKIRRIHAGLECGIICGLYPEMDIISLGPTIRDAHSPSEALNLQSLDKVWQLLQRLLADLC